MARRRFDRGAVRGMAAVRRSFKNVVPVMQEELGTATRETGKAIKARAQERVPVRLGYLKKAIAFRYSKRSGVGRVGIKKQKIGVQGTGGSAERRHGARVIYPTRYAHLVEFGTTHSRAQPFMLPSVEAEREPYLTRAKAAGARAEDALARGAARG